MLTKPYHSFIKEERRIWNEINNDTRCNSDPLQEVLDDGVMSPDIYTYQGVCFFQLERGQEAIASYDEALVQDGACHDALKGLAQCLLSDPALASTEVRLHLPYVVPQNIPSSRRKIQFFLYIFDIFKPSEKTGHVHTPARPVPWHTKSWALPWGAGDGTLETRQLRSMLQ